MIGLVDTILSFKTEKLNKEEFPVLAKRELFSSDEEYWNNLNAKERFDLWNFGLHIYIVTPNMRLCCTDGKEDDYTSIPKAHKKYINKILTHSNNTFYKYDILSMVKNTI